eukprot:3051749-Prymnesium_polylepis.1
MRTLTFEREPNDSCLPLRLSPGKRSRCTSGLSPVSSSSDEASPLGARSPVGLTPESCRIKSSRVVSCARAAPPRRRACGGGGRLAGGVSRPAEGQEIGYGEPSDH